jgi:hypothetical protein
MTVGAQIPINMHSNLVPQVIHSSLISLLLLEISYYPLISISLIRLVTFGLTMFGGGRRYYGLRGQRL